MAASTGTMGATNLLALLLSALSHTTPGDDERGISVNEMTTVEAGVAAEVEIPSGDRYLVIVQWQGDKEATPDHV